MRMWPPMVPELMVLLFVILFSGTLLLVYWMSR